MNIYLVKISFSEIKGFDNFVIYQILTKLQHFRHYNVKFHLQVGPYIIGLTGDDIIMMVMLEFFQNLVNDEVVKSFNLIKRYFQNDMNYTH